MKINTFSTGKGSQLRGYSDTCSNDKAFQPLLLAELDHSVVAAVKRAQHKNIFASLAAMNSAELLKYLNLGIKVFTFAEIYLRLLTTVKICSTA